MLFLVFGFSIIDPYVQPYPNTTLSDITVAL